MLRVIGDSAETIEREIVWKLLSGVKLTINHAARTAATTRSPLRNFAAGSTPPNSRDPPEDPL